MKPEPAYILAWSALAQGLEILGHKFDIRLGQTIFSNAEIYWAQG